MTTASLWWWKSVRPSRMLLPLRCWWGGSPTASSCQAGNHSSSGSAPAHWTHLLTNSNSPKVQHCSTVTCQHCYCCRHCLPPRPRHWPRREDAHMAAPHASSRCGTTPLGKPALVVSWMEGLHHEVHYHRAASSVRALTPQPTGTRCPQASEASPFRQWLLWWVSRTNTRDISPYTPQQPSWRTTASCQALRPRVRDPFQGPTGLSTVCCVTTSSIVILWTMQTCCPCCQQAVDSVLPPVLCCAGQPGGNTSTAILPAPGAGGPWVWSVQTRHVRPSPPVAIS